MLDAIGNAAGAALTLSFSRIVGNNSASGAGAPSMRDAGVSAVFVSMTFVVLVIIAVTKFIHGAWVVAVLIPVMVVSRTVLKTDGSTESCTMKQLRTWNRQGRVLLVRFTFAV